MPTSNRLSTKIRLIMLCLSGFELYSRWVPLLSIAKARGHRMTSGILNRGTTHGFHELYALFFAEETNLNFNSYLTVVRSFTLHSTTNLLKANKAIPALFLSSKPQELKRFD